MNAVLHFPKALSAKRELARQAAFFHAQAVLKTIDRMPLSDCQKLALIDLLIKG